MASEKQQRQSFHSNIPNTNVYVPLTDNKYNCHTGFRWKHKSLDLDLETIWHLCLNYVLWMLDLSQWILLLTLSSARFLIGLIKRKRENKTKGQKQLKGWNLMQKTTLTTYSSCIFFVVLLNSCIKFSSAHIDFKCKEMSELIFYAFNWIINLF